MGGSNTICRNRDRIHSSPEIFGDFGYLCALLQNWDWHDFSVILNMANFHDFWYVPCPYPLVGAGDCLVGPGFVGSILVLAVLDKLVDGRLGPCLRASVVRQILSSNS